VSDASRLPFADTGFPLILSRDLLNHIPSREQVARELMRVAHERALIAEPNALAPFTAVFAAPRRAEHGIPEANFWGLRDLLQRAAPGWLIRRILFEPKSLTRVLQRLRFRCPTLA
jgi:hypothetical protein